MAKHMNIVGDPSWWGDLGPGPLPPPKIRRCGQSLCLFSCFFILHGQRKDLDVIRSVDHGTGIMLNQLQQQRYTKHRGSHRATQRTNSQIDEKTPLWLQRSVGRMC